MAKFCSVSGLSGNNGTTMAKKPVPALAVERVHTCPVVQPVSVPVYDDAHLISDVGCVKAAAVLLQVRLNEVDDALKELDSDIDTAAYIAESAHDYTMSHEIEIERHGEAVRDLQNDVMVADSNFDAAACDIAALKDRQWLMAVVYGGLLISQFALDAYVFYWMFH
jgi:hypothetical protein